MAQQSQILYWGACQIRLAGGIRTECTQHPHFAAHNKHCHFQFESSETDNMVFLINFPSAKVVERPVVGQHVGLQR